MFAISAIVVFGALMVNVVSRSPSRKHLRTKVTPDFHLTYSNQRTIGPVNAHLISWPSKAQNIQNLENIW